MPPFWLFYELFRYIGKTQHTVIYITHFILQQTSFLYAPCMTRNEPGCDDDQGENRIGVGYNGGGSSDNPSSPPTLSVDDLQPTSSNI